MSLCPIVPMSKNHFLCIENQMFKFLNMKMTRTAPDVFNICDLSAGELTAILTSIELSTKYNIDKDKGQRTKYNVDKC